jgi:hypothetical protein
VISHCFGVSIQHANKRTTKILGIIPLGTSLDYESPRSRDLGCWHAVDPLADRITGEFGTRSNEPTPDFVPSTDFCNFLIDVGFGKEECPKDIRNFWIDEIKKNYRGDEGRRRIRMCAINLRDRDGLHMRLDDVLCPVLWLHVSRWPIFSFNPRRRCWSHRVVVPWVGFATDHR